MSREKEQVEISLLGRLLSLEALIFLMGIVSLIYGVATLTLANIIIGAAVLVAAALYARKLRRGVPK
jgi:hypothetical protein